MGNLYDLPLNYGTKSDRNPHKTHYNYALSIFLSNRQELLGIIFGFSAGISGNRSVLGSSPTRGAIRDRSALRDLSRSEKKARIFSLHGIKINFLAQKILDQAA